MGASSGRRTPNRRHVAATRGATSAHVADITTPEHIIDGIGVGVGKAGARFAECPLFLHGTTVAINAVLEVPMDRIDHDVAIGDHAHGHHHALALLDHPPKASLAASLKSEASTWMTLTDTVVPARPASPP